MKITEIGLSFRQRISETCLSGYVEIIDIDDNYVICLEFNKHFEGNGTLFIDIMTDSDDGFLSPNVINTTGPLKYDNITCGSSTCIKISKLQIERFICLYYRITEGSFTSGEITARISSNENAWFVCKEMT